MGVKDLKLKVLIIDDENDLRMTIKEVFEIFGWEVHDAENGNKGVEKMLAHQFDFVISDIRMPGSTGIEFLQKLPHQMKKDTPIIMMSAYSEYTTKMVEQLGAWKLISKPVSIHELIREMDGADIKKKSA